MSDDPVLGTKVLPCGCVVEAFMENGKKVATIAPCRKDCINFKNTLDLARELGSKVEHKRLP